MHFWREAFRTFFLLFCRIGCSSTWKDVLVLSYLFLFFHTVFLLLCGSFDQLLLLTCESSSIFSNEQLPPAISIPYLRVVIFPARMKFQIRFLASRYVKLNSFCILRESAFFHSTFKIFCIAAYTVRRRSVFYN